MATTPKVSPRRRYRVLESVHSPAGAHEPGEIVTDHPPHAGGARCFRDEHGRMWREVPSTGTRTAELLPEPYSFDDHLAAGRVELVAGKEA